MTDVPVLSDAEWVALTERLTLYASFKVARLRWRGMEWMAGGKAVPGALAPSDLAAEAIVAAIEGVRRWNPGSEPTFEEFLKGVIDSKVSHLSRSIDNRRSRAMPHTVDESGRETPLDPPGGETAPDVALAAQEDMDALRSTVVGAIGDDPLAKDLLECLDAGIEKPADIAVVLEIEVEAVYAARQRMKRAILRADPALHRRIKKRRRK